MPPGGNGYYYGKGRNLVAKELVREFGSLKGVPGFYEQADGTARKFRTFLPSCFKDLPERIYSGQGNDRGMEHMVCEQGFFLTLRYVADRERAG